MLREDRGRYVTDYARSVLGSEVEVNEDFATNLVRFSWRGIQGAIPRRDFVDADPSMINERVLKLCRDMYEEYERRENAMREMAMRQYRTQQLAGTLNALGQGLGGAAGLLGAGQGLGALAQAQSLAQIQRNAAQAFGKQTLSIEPPRVPWDQPKPETEIDKLRQRVNEMRVKLCA